MNWGAVRLQLREIPLIYIVIQGADKRNKNYFQINYEPDKMSIIG